MKEIKYEKLTLLLNGSETAYSVVSCEKDAVEVTIPKSVDGIPVTDIGESAFEDCISLRSVIFPKYPYAEDDVQALIDYDVLKEIGEYAFSGCVSLLSVDIPCTVTSIGRGAFHSCSSLRRARFREGIFVGSYAFYRCKSLTDVTPVTDINEGTFSFCESLAYFPVAKGTEVISEDAFEHCYALENIVIPASVKRIEQLAFRNCRGLKKVTFEDGEDWYVRLRYTSVEDKKLNLSAPEKNAYWLAWMDFDDGVELWYKKGAVKDREDLDAFWDKLLND